LWENHPQMCSMFGKINIKLLNLIKVLNKVFNDQRVSDDDVIQWPKKKHT